MKNEKVLLLVLACLFICCYEDKVDLANSDDLKGKWVELETRMDTFYFESLDNKEVLNLQRGKEMKNGHLLPKSGSGPYAYKLSEGKISLLWMLSSNSNFQDYDFEIMGNRLQIGNFYSSASTETLVFEKLD